MFPDSEPNPIINAAGERLVGELLREQRKIPVEALITTNEQERLVEPGYPEWPLVGWMRNKLAELKSVINLRFSGRPETFEELHQDMLSGRFPR